ncbi:hypothetical protein E4T56_gene18627 [Termitomyces sp. T112]|nr:hypothetical protein E4T56_gene18627 [Termitomyces sp. T112]
MTSSPPSTQIGRYGTISLMKRQDSSAPLTAFGIDTPELTFGRDPSCGVRLYYSEIAVVHCRIIFNEDRKAFMSVLGENGAMVDGCFVKGGEIVPLINGSEFEIRGKRFRFAYPPKEMRAALYASPLPTRMPRLSLITSTQVFSPRPSPDPRENLRILKSPLKNTFKARNRGTTPLRTVFAQASSRYAYNSPMKPSTSASLTVDEDDEDEEDSIILVDGNHPRVVEDEKDLVILEDIDRPISPSDSPYASHPQQTYLHAPQPRTVQQEPPKTPVRRRSQSLHRAVLIRSAQRAVLKAERDREEEEIEEMEVLDVVAGLDHEEDGKKQEYEYEYEDTPMDVDMDVDIEEPLAGCSDDEQNKEEPTKQEPKQKLTWRKSFERLWPFRNLSPTKDEEDSEDEEENENENETSAPLPPPSPSTSPTNADDDDDAEEENENEHPAPLLAPRTPLRPPHNRALGAFMTPQPRIGTSVSDPTIQRANEQDRMGGGVGQGRLSLGGGEARRVLVEPQVWRVRDIVLPPMEPVAGRGGLTRGVSASPVRPGVSASARKVLVGEEERKAIQERRRSALREPSGPGFVPGFSPMKPPSSSTSIHAKQVSPTKASTRPTLPTLSTFEKEDEEEDTRRLLERMKETVEGMKKRRSEVPQHPLPQVLATPIRPPFTPGRGRSPVKKGEVFSLLRMEPREDDVQKEVEVNNDEEVLSLEEKENEGAQAPTSTPVREDLAANEVSKDKNLVHEKLRLGSPTPVVRNESEVVSTEPTREKPGLRSRTRSPASIRVHEGEGTQEKPRSKSKAKSPAPLHVQEPEDMSTEPALKNPRSRSKAKSPAPVRVPEDKDKDGVIMEAGEPKIELTPETAIIEPEESARAEKPPSKLYSRSKSALRAPAPSRRTRVSPAPGSGIKESGEEPQEAPMKRGRKAITTMTPSTTPAPSTSISNTAQEESAPTRRGRKPKVEPEDKEAPKRGRRLGVTTAATDAVKETEASRRGVRRTPASAPAPVVDNEEPVKRGRTLRAGSVVSSSKPTSKTTRMMENDGEDERKGTAKGRKRTGTIKKEDDDGGSVSGESSNASTTTTITTNATTTTAKSRTFGVGARTRKTPASAPPVTAQEVNKENENGVEEDVKVRVSRKGRGKKDVLAQEDDEVQAGVEVKEVVKEVVKARITRTRTRTRT